MPKFSAKQRKMRGQGKSGGPAFIQLFHYVKRSTAYHGLSLVARALLIELIDRYNGCNNGMIVLGVRQAAYELDCSKDTVSRAMRELDDADLARPTAIGAWRGRHATEWRLMWKLCNKTGDLPRRNWIERKPYVQLLLPKPKRKPPLTNAERCHRYRQKATRDRHDKSDHKDTEVRPEGHRHVASPTTRMQNGNSSITTRNPSPTTGTHVHVYQEGECCDDAQTDIEEAIAASERESFDT